MASSTWLVQISTCPIQMETATPMLLSFRWLEFPSRTPVVVQLREIAPRSISSSSMVSIERSGQIVCCDFNGLRVGAFLQS